MAQSALEANKSRQDKRQLNDEDEGREHRVEERRKQRIKQDAIKRAKRRRRMVKMSLAWVGVIFVTFLGVTWFSGNLVSWMEQFG